MRQFRKTAIAIGVAQVVLTANGVAFAQTAPADGGGSNNVVVVVGQRAALESAAQIKKNSDEIVDSIVADDIGKLPDRSVTEVLQRIPGVTIDRTLNRADPMQGVGDGILHFAAEGSGVSVRGLSYVRSELNGRDSFSANGGRSLSFEDVPPELMAGVDVYKNPSAEQIEGAVGGLVNLRTAMPFDFKGAKAAFSLEAARADRRGQTKPAFSGLLSNRWNTDLGQFGALIDLAHSEISTASDGIGASPYIPRANIDPGQMRWITPGANWTSNTFDRKRDGLYGALQWKKGDLASGLTVFKSKYKMATEENGFFMTTNPATVAVDPGATYDAKGALLTGVLRNPADGGFGIGNGIGFGTDERFSAREADTTDVSWNGTWKASDRWLFRADVQHVRANTRGYDNTVGTGGFMPKSTVDLTTSPPTYTFDAADRAWLADPSHYYWSFAQEHRDQASAKQTAARLDAKYDFDSPVLQDLRFGLRATEREAVTHRTHGGDGGNEWANITQGWSVGNSWQPYSAFAKLTDPRLEQSYTTHAFNNFFNGKLPMPPTIIVPTPATVAGSYDATPPMFRTLHDNANYFCNGTCPDWTKWSPSVFGGPRDTNEQHERTTAAFGQLRFGLDQLPYPVDGNLGVRVVKTNSSAVGLLLFSPPSGQQPPGVPSIPAQSEQRSFENTYTNVLPSLNLKMKASSELQFRFAASKGMARPDFYSMQAYTSLNQNIHTHTDTATQQSVLDSIDYTGTANGNPMLKPTTSNNLDLTAEYYFGHGSSVTLALFNKQVKDIVIGRTSFYTLTDTAGQGHDFLTTGPVNGATGRASGAELGFQHYFDKLPDLLSGFGVSGNYTYIRSKLNMNAPTSLWCTPSGTLDANLARDLNGCDTDGHTLGGVPMTGMSKNAYNLALLYDKGPWSARMAYSWRSKYLQAVNAFGTNGGEGIDQNPASPNKGNAYSVQYALPTWGGEYGQLDMGVQYKVTDKLTVAFNASNLNNAMYKQYMQQQIGLKEHFAFFTGRSYYLQMRYSY